MPTNPSSQQFLENLRRSGLVSNQILEPYLANFTTLPPDQNDLADLMVRDRLLTLFQANLIKIGRFRGFHMGSYVLQEVIGQGGMGTVYLAMHSQLRRKAAIKVLNASVAEEPKQVERFRREARAAAALDHVNIVGLYDVAQEGELHYLVMEYVEGRTLDLVLKESGAIPYEQAAMYVAQVAVGLQHAYEMGFVHRDIKPSNLILTQDFSVKILDMGLARSFENGDNVTGTIAEKSISGTADYIAPELTKPDSKVDIRSDIYSLGATFFTLVTNRPIYEGTVASKLLQKQVKDAPLVTEFLPDFPKDLTRVVSKMLAREPDQRFQEPIEIVQELTPYLEGNLTILTGVTQTKAGKSGRISSKKLLGDSAERRARLRRQLAWIVAAAMAVILATLIITIVVIYFRST